MARVTKLAAVVAGLFVLWAIAPTAPAEPGPVAESVADAPILAENNIDPSREGVTAYLRLLKAELEEVKTAAGLVRQLGDGKFRVREAATQRLIDGPALPLAALRQATAAADPEVAVRAKRVLGHPQVAAKVSRAESRPRVGAAVFRTIQNKRILGMTPDLFDVIGLLDDPDLLDAAAEAIAETAGPDDAPMLRRGLADKNLNSRIGAVRGLAGADVKGEVALRPLMDDTEPRLALAAAHTLAHRGDRTALAGLVRLASSTDERVRARGEQILRAWTGQNFGCNPFEDPAAQKENLARWRAWVAAEGRTAELNLPLRLAPLPEDMRRGLLLHYAFDEAPDGRLTDASGHRRHGTVRHEHSLVTGVTGKALEVRGAGDTGDHGGHADVPFIDFATLDQFTVALWVRERGMSDDHGEAYVVFGADRGVGTDDSLGVSHFNASIFYRVGGAQVIVPFDPADRGRWVHYALTFQAGALRAYKDGRPAGEEKGRVNVVGKQAALGRHWWHHGEVTSARFIGEFDELRVYQRALTPSQVGLLHSAVGPIKKSGNAPPAK